MNLLVDYAETASAAAKVGVEAVNLFEYAGSLREDCELLSGVVGHAEVVAGVSSFQGTWVPALTVASTGAGALATTMGATSGTFLGADQGLLGTLPGIGPGGG